ncbi:MAG: DUF4465 domain-containing protein [Prolixibacteraceae bacterium]|jgi:hypothetical protein
MYSINNYDYIINDWRWISLQKLGRISKLEFSLRSSDSGDFGMNTPGYFCIGNLNHEVPTAATEIKQLHASVYPNPFTDFLTISGISESANVSISDISGRKIAEYKDVTNNQNLSGLSGLKSGIYMVKVTEGKNTFTSKLVKK